MTLARTILARIVPVVVLLLAGAVGEAAAQWPGTPSAAPPRPAGPSPFDNPPAAARKPSPFDSAPTSSQPVFGPPSGGFGPPGGSPGFGPPQQQGGEPPCMKDFIPLREDAEKKAGLIRAATQRKAPREEICKLITNFSTAEGKMLQFFEAKSSSCGIPKQLTTQMKASHDRTVKARTQVCSAAPAGGQPAAPSLSDALGTATAPIPEAAKNGGSNAFDTMTGNALTR